MDSTQAGLRVATDATTIFERTPDADVDAAGVSFAEIGGVVIRTQVQWAVHRFKTSVLSASVAVLGPLSCAGPQPLCGAIDQHDEDRYVGHLNEVNGDAATAYVNWMASERGMTTAEVLRADECVSTTRNPFDAYRDPGAVRRGAVMYKLHCACCHANDARGHGPSTLPDYPATDFKTFGKRLAATLHRGAPRKWFRAIRDGRGDVVKYPDERTTAMPAFGDKLTREQIWLVITYLQSLDMHATGP